VALCENYMNLCVQKLMLGSYHFGIIINKPLKYNDMNENPKQPSMSSEEMIV
jgi:hypothetical protein